MKKWRTKLKRAAALALVMMMVGNLVDLSVFTAYAENTTSNITRTEASGTISYQPCEGEGTQDSPYLIANADNLYWFAEVVNHGYGDTAKNPAACAKLTQNIVVNSNVLTEEGELSPDVSNFKVWTPIGSIENLYTGTFDGNGNTISGLYADTTADYVGLFGFTAGTIQQIGIIDSYFSGRDNVGGIAGRNYGSIANSYNTGSISGSNKVGGIAGYNSSSITNSYNTGSISGSNSVGGIAGDNYGSIANSYNTGSISGEMSVGGIAGYNRSSIANSYNTGSISGSNSVGGIVGYNVGSITNSYYLSENETDEIAGTTAKTALQFASGEVTYLLNGSTSTPKEGEQLIWYQTCGEGLPAFSGQIVYGGYAEDTSCTDGKPKSYSNDESAVSGALQHTDESYKNGFRECCGEYEACEGEGTRENPYLITNAGNLYWFAEVVNHGYGDTTKNPAACAKLTKNIVVNSKVLTEEGGIKYRCK